MREGVKAMEASLCRHFKRMRSKLGYALSILPVELKDDENRNARREAADLLSHDEFVLAIDVLREISGLANKFPLSAALIGQAEHEISAFTPCLLEVSTVTVRLDEVRDWAGFHDVFQRQLSFPAYYGANMDAWIDCLEDHVGVIDGRIVISIEGWRSFATRAQEIATAMVECLAFLNHERKAVSICLELDT